MKPIEFDHSLDRHSVAGARAALRAIFPDATPSSMLDVGCGTGTWLRAALDLQIPEVLGVDGVDVPVAELLVSAEHFRCLDIREPWNLGRDFDVAICLEVAEHLPERHATLLVDSLVAHATTVVFSAACPGQGGQHHVNCQWPAYWQELFNVHGYVCSDSIRWAIWDADEIEPWYRQNMFIASRDERSAGSEPRIQSVVHPEIARVMVGDAAAQSLRDDLARLESGSMTMGWYLRAVVTSFISKLRRAVTGRGRIRRGADGD